jgi:hypothetical protein
VICSDRRTMRVEVALGAATAKEMTFYFAALLRRSTLRCHSVRRSAEHLTPTKLRHCIHEECGGACRDGRLEH